MAMGKKGGNMSYEAVHIAKYIINKCTIDQHPISNLQLQKILYCIQRDFLKNDKYPYGKPQTDEVARGSGTESMAVRD